VAAWLVITAGAPLYTLVWRLLRSLITEARKRVGSWEGTRIRALTFQRQEIF